MVVRVHPGERHGLLIFMSATQRTAGERHRFGLWQCDCGNITRAAISRVVNGYTRSCGCLSREVGAQASRTHGRRNTREYRQWQGAKGRCFNESSRDFPRYGGRGISMCPLWAGSFAAFFADMGECPAGLSLDRINVNGNYEPGNCRWATPYEQAVNRRNTVRTAFGTTTDMAAALGISKGAAYMRHKRGRIYV